jgi:hypothetical protein
MVEARRVFSLSSLTPLPLTAPLCSIVITPLDWIETFSDEDWVVVYCIAGHRVHPPFYLQIELKIREGVEFPRLGM